ncbi:MAG: hypothetical protein JO112_06490 [Planctomycetes bacterium]|nr:hypothetical protein [Planctomycetota bacterium]
MSRTYFEVTHDFPETGRWYLNGLFDRSKRKIDSRIFRYGLPIEAGPPLRLPSQADGSMAEVDGPLAFSIRRNGEPLDFTLADFDVPVATKRISELLSAIANKDIQKFPVWVESRTEPYEIINVRSRVACIDRQRSKIEWWREVDRRPDKLGKPRTITKLVIDATLVGEQHLFRPEGWEVVLIVSDMVKGVLEDAGVSGLKFRLVS